MKLAFVSTWDENSEGNSTGMPKLNLDGVTINDSVVEWFRSHYNSGYVNPKYVGGQILPPLIINMLEYMMQSMYQK